MEPQDAARSASKAARHSMGRRSRLDASSRPPGRISQAASTSGASSRRSWLTWQTTRGAGGRKGGAGGHGSREQGLSAGSLFTLRASKSSLLCRLYSQSGTQALSPLSPP